MEETVSTMLSMPAELLHRIIDCLDAPDIFSTRLTCATLAEVGKEHILHQIATIYKRDWLDRLVAAAEDPYFSQRITGLHFQADKFDVKLPYEEFKARVKRFRENERAFAAITGDDNDPKTWSSSKTTEMIRALASVEVVEGDEPEDSEVQPAHAVYSDVVDDQELMDAQKYATTCFTKLFTNCPKLTKVTITIGSGQGTCYDIVRRVFKDCIEPPHIQEPIGQGDQQFFCLVEALQATKKALTSLTIDQASYDVLCIPTELSPGMPAIMSSLKAFRFGITSHLDEAEGHGEDMFAAIEEDAHEVMRQGELRRWLAAATELRILKLKMPDFDDDGEFSRYISLADAVGNLQWKDLRELSLGQFETTEEQLFHLLLRHKATLRRLNLQYIDLSEGGWDSLFQRLAGQISELRYVTLRGDLKVGGQIYHNFELPGVDDGVIDAYRDHIEDRILNGGTILTPETDDPHEDMNPLFARMLEDGHDGRVASEVEGYEPPWRKGLPDEKDESEMEDAFDCD